MLGLSIAFSVSRNPLYRKCSANARLYILVALCQYMYLCPSGTVPMHASISLRLFSSGTVPIPATMGSFKWHYANVHLYVYFLVAQRQCLHLRVFSSGTGSLHA